MISFIESAYFGFHKKRGNGFQDFVYNNSLMVSTAGLMRAFLPEYYEELGQYLDIRYARCDIDSDASSPLKGTVYHSLSIHLKNIF